MIEDVFSVADRVVLITGSGRGVGAGTAQLFAEQGATVIVNDLYAERAQAVVDEIIAGGGRAVPAPFDITDRTQLAEGLAAAIAQTGPVEILVHNAGVIEGEGRPNLFATMPQADWQLQLDLNLIAFMRFIQAVLPSMITAGWGRIVQISSTAATRGAGMGLAPYGAAKSAGEGLMRHLAVENGRHGITVNSLSLGMMQGLPTDDPRLSAGIEAIPTRRLTTPRDVAVALVWLCSRAGEQVTGQVVQLAGGSHFGR